MKKTIIGCCLTIVGVLSNVLFFICSSYYVDSLTGWSTPPGRFLTAFEETGLSVLLIPMIIATAIMVTGLSILLKEYFKN